MPVAVQMVLALLGKKLEGAAEPFFGAQGLGQVGVGGRHPKDVGLSAQLLGRMGVGVGDQQEAVQGRDPPVHGGVGGEPGFQGVNVGQACLKALLQGIEAAAAPQYRKPGGPDMGRDHQGLGVGLQHQLQHLPGIQAQDGAAVGGDVAQAAQALREL